MRAGTQDYEFLKIDDELVGVNLGWDFCAEHEWGIKGIRREFGLEDDKLKPFGIKKRTIKNVLGENQLAFYRDKDKALLVFEDYGYAKLFEEIAKKKQINKTAWKKMLPHDLRINTYGYDKDMGTAWSENDFAVLVTAKYADDLEAIYEAFMRKDIAIWLGGGANPFSNAGLVLGIVSKIPEEIKKGMADDDEDHYKLKKAAEKTGIEKLLSKNGKNWYSLRPSWKNEEKTEIQFWLNPREQNKYNSGWYSVEDLKLWAENKGPIVKETSHA